MRIRIRDVEGIKVLDVEGKMLRGEGDTLLQQSITDLIDDGYDHLIVNLSGVPYIDSSGLGELVRSFTLVRRLGGKVGLTNLSPRIIDLLTITKLSTVFDTYETDEDAVRAMRH